MAAPAAPAAGGLAITGALLLEVFAWAALFGLLYMYRYTLGAFIRKLATMVDDIWIVGGTLADALNKMDSYVQARIGDGLAELEDAMAMTWGALTYVVEQTGDALVWFGHSMHDTIAGLVYGEIPQQVDAKTRPLGQAVGKANAAQNARAQAEARARARGIDRLERDFAGEALRRQRGIDAIRARLNAQVMPRLRALDVAVDGLVGYTRRTLNRRLSRVEQLVLGGAIAAGAVAALTRVFPYWQCTNVRRFNKLLCRAPIGALDDLLGLALLAVGPLSIVALAEELQAVMEPAESGVRYFVTETKG